MNAAEPVCPSLDAVMDTLPAATAVTSPETETVAIPVFPEVQLITRPVSTLLLASRVTADSCADAPTCRLALAGDTDTDATGTGAGALTLRDAEPVLPSLAAVIAVLPGATAETSPADDTTATLELVLCQVMVRPESGFPKASLGTAVAWAVCPTTTAAGLIATEMSAIGVGVGGCTVIVF